MASGDGAWLYYVKNLNFKKKKVKFDDMIEDNPKLLKEFQYETTSSKEAKKLYTRNFLEIHRRYIKLYCDQLPKK